MSEDVFSKLASQQAARDTQTSIVGLGSQPWSPELVTTLVFYLLGFTVIVLVAITLLLYRSKAGPSSILRVFSIVCIIALSSVLLIIGYNRDQLTPIVGLFGAIAGYLLGKDPKEGEA